MSRSPTPRRRATLASLAAELKVSRTTISNAYNRPDQLSADLRERVLATAKRLGYPGPDPVARSLRTRKAGAVGLMITEPLNYSFSDPAALDFVAGLAESCEDAGQGLLLVAVGPNRAVSDGSAAVLAAGVDGFVVYSASDDDPYLQVVQQRHLPVVVVDQPKDVPGTSQGLHRRPGGDGGARQTRCRTWPPRHRAAHDAVGPRPSARRPAGRGGEPGAARRHRTFTSSGSASTASTTR